MFWLIFCYPDPEADSDPADQNETDPNGSGSATLRFIVWESNHLSFRNRTTYHLGIGTFPGKRDILSSGNDFILWESGHLSSGNRTTYPLGFGTSSGKRDMGNGTLYPLGIGPLILWETGISILWESGKGEMRYNPYIINIL